MKFFITLMVCISILFTFSPAQAAQQTILNETFSSGLGNFSSAGYVSTGTSGAQMRGSLYSRDGRITSTAINTQGLTDIVLTFDSATGGLDYYEAAIVSFSTNGSSYTTISSQRNASGSYTFNLGGAAENQSQLYLRFQISASSYYETYTVDNIVLTAGIDDSGGDGDDNNSTDCTTCIGPDPTEASLEAPLGPFSYTSFGLSSWNVYGFGGGDIFYPTNAPSGSLAAIAICPGYLGTSETIDWWGPRLASHGFIVLVMDPNSIYDQPTSRANQLMACQDELADQNNTPGSPIYGMVDSSRMGLMGHSMGGGGTLIATEANANNPNLKAAIPLAPWNILSSNFSGINAATLVVACELDAIAPVYQHARPFYNSIPSTVPKAFLEINNGDHLCVMNGDQFEDVLGKYGVAWMKRFLDEDHRYDQFLCGPNHEGDWDISDYSSSCPY